MKITISREVDFYFTGYYLQVVNFDSDELLDLYVVKLDLARNMRIGYPYYIPEDYSIIEPIDPRRVNLESLGHLTLRELEKYKNEYFVLLCMIEGQSYIHLVEKTSFEEIMNEIEDSLEYTVSIWKASDFKFGRYYTLANGNLYKSKTQRSLNKIIEAFHCGIRVGSWEYDNRVYSRKYYIGSLHFATEAIIIMFPYIFEDNDLYHMSCEEVFSEKTFLRFREKYGSDGLFRSFLEFHRSVSYTVVIFEPNWFSRIVNINKISLMVQEGAFDDSSQWFVPSTYPRFSGPGYDHLEKDIVPCKIMFNDVRSDVMKHINARFNTFRINYANSLEM